MLKSKNGPIEVFLCPDIKAVATERSPVKQVDESSGSSFTSEDSADSFRSRSSGASCLAVFSSKLMVLYIISYS